MKYMIMECHRSYAVALDEEGRFLKVANLHYEVGQTVDSVFEMKSPDTSAQNEVVEAPSKRKNYKWLSAITVAAACMVLIFSSVMSMSRDVIGSVYISINPEVRVDVNKFDKVVALEGINQDGKDLIEGYDYKKKELDIVADELVDRAIDMGYLKEGKNITLSLDGSDANWKTTRGEKLNDHLDKYLKEKLSVTINIESYSDYEQHSAEITIPPKEDNREDNGQTDYGTSQTPYDTDYGPNNDGVTDYDKDDGDTDYGNGNDGVTDYDDRDDDSDSDDDDDDDDDDSNYH